MNFQKKIIIVLPAFNEASRLGILLQKIKSVMMGQAYAIVVVDDASTDATATIVQNTSTFQPLTIIHHRQNQGLGPTIRDGLLQALAMAEDQDVIVTMDADDTHDPALIPAMIKKMQSGADVVIASRYQTGSHILGLSWFRQRLSDSAALLFHLTFPIPGVKDYTCGYRAYRAHLLRQGFSTFGSHFIDQQGFQCMVDIVLKLSTLKVRWAEVPMVLHYDQKDGKSKMKVGRTVLATFGLILRRKMNR